MITPSSKAAVLFALSLAGSFGFFLAPTLPTAQAEEANHAPKADTPPEDKRWQAVAPGRVEPASGEIKIAAPVVGIIREVLVKANDKVFEGEPLIQLDDTEARARLATSEAQAAMRRRTRNDENASSRTADTTPCGRRGF